MAKKKYNLKCIRCGKMLSIPKANRTGYCGTCTASYEIKKLLGWRK